MRYYELILEYNEKKLLSDFGTKLVARYKQETGKNLTSKQLLDYIASKDTTPTKELVMWCCSRYTKWVPDINGYGINKFEDIASRAIPGLLEYKVLLRKPNLQPALPFRDINQIKSLNQLESILDRYKKEDITTESPEVIAKEQKFIKSGEARVIYNDAHVSVVVPKTEEASCFFGRGTKWCTAAKNNNMFADYNGKGQLYRITNEKRRRIQSINRKSYKISIRNG